ncbi:Protein LOV-1 [Aphelenchoides avenae]|nr:Protein LOV-1 [Aphelenchus avenae]
MMYEKYYDACSNVAACGTAMLPVQRYGAFICSLVCYKFFPLRALITKHEREILDIDPVEKFAAVRYPPINPMLGKTVADLVKLKEARESRLRDEYLFETVREFLAFAVSIFVLVGMATTSRNSVAFDYQAQMRDLLHLKQTDSDPPNATAFLQITKPDEFWRWAKTDLVKALRVSWYDSKPAWGMRGFMNDKVSRSMGIGMMRQVRSKRDVNCHIFDSFQQMFSSCVGPTRRKYEDNTPAYTIGWKEPTNASDTLPEFVYKSSEELNGILSTGV